MWTILVYRPRVLQGDARSLDYSPYGLYGDYIGILPYLHPIMKNEMIEVGAFEGGEVMETLSPHLEP